MHNYSTTVVNMKKRPFQGEVGIPTPCRSAVTSDLRRSPSARSIIINYPKSISVDKSLEAEQKGYPHCATGTSEHGTNTVGGTTQEREK